MIVGRWLAELPTGMAPGGRGRGADAPGRAVQGDVIDAAHQVVVVRAKINGTEPDDSVFDSAEDFVTATRRLQTIKALSPDSEDATDDCAGNVQ